VLYVQQFQNAGSICMGNGPAERVLELFLVVKSVSDRGIKMEPAHLKFVRKTSGSQ
jgi:hypothetical protein